VGLATDLAEVTLPCCDGEMAASFSEGSDARRLELVSPVTVRPLGAEAGAVEFRLQLAALRDEAEAKKLAERARTRGGLEPVEVTFEALSGLYRVRGGRFPDKPAARQAADQLVARGFELPWVVAVPLTPPTATGLEVRYRGTTYRIEGRRVVVAAGGPDGTVRFQGRRYRGSLEVVLNARGLLNVVNVLPLEDYLRGVVPKELGPEAYPEFEALKAQAVAARTYAVSHLGEFSEEGFDLCATPRCQVYGGADAEHPLSDRAVAETAGEVLLALGAPIEAFYSATCGGHTEDVEVVFPGRSSPALVGVPCLEEGPVPLHLPSPAVGSLSEEVLRKALGESLELTTREGLERGVVRLLELAGVEPVRSSRLPALEGAALVRYLSGLLQLDSAVALMVQPEETEYLLGSPVTVWPKDVRLAAAYLAKSGVVPLPPGNPLSRDRLTEFLFRLGLWLGTFELQRAQFEAVQDGMLRVRIGDRLAAWSLTPPPAAFRRLGGQLLPAQDLSLLVGDRIELYARENRLLALVHEVHPEGISFDRDHPRTSWVRFRSDEELRRLVRERFPGFDFYSFEILRRGRSGRVAALRLRSRDGSEEVVEGLAIRWVLDLPDTWFLAERLSNKNGQWGWRFRGRGWGHGVGLCQVGAVGMARRGHAYQAILAHYYRGAQLMRLETVETP
jgi:stage II sporulation protein D